MCCAVFCIKSRDLYTQLHTDKIHKSNYYISYVRLDHIYYDWSYGAILRTLIQTLSK